jgi:hypothetical protein
MASEQSFRCPTCGYEYQAWVKVCPDCGSAIEARPGLELIKGKLEPDDDPRWTIVTNVPNAILGTFMKSQLEDAGIPVLMFRSRSADIAEFSHNDYVPQDLLVPLDRAREARRLIDSAPGNSYGPYEWEDEPEEPDESEGEDEPQARDVAPEQQPQASSLPDGWHMLPSEADLHARQQVRRTHGSVLRGWYWSDSKSGPAAGYPERGTDDDEDYDDYDDYGAYDGPAGYSSAGDRFSAYRTTSSNPNDDWTKPKRWVKIFYGVLLLVMSLPFLAQLLERLLSIFGQR